MQNWIKLEFEGFCNGRNYERIDSALSKVTPNEIRAAVGLPPIDGCKKGE